MGLKKKKITEGYHELDELVNGLINGTNSKKLIYKSYLFAFCTQIIKSCRTVIHDHHTAHAETTK